MGTISIHGLDPEIEKALKEQAKKSNKSLSSFLKELINRNITVNRGNDKNHYRFKRFCGKWTDEEYKGFCSATEDFNKINSEDWR